MAELLHWPWSIFTVWIGSFAVMGLLLAIGRAAALRQLAAREKVEQDARERYADVLRRLGGGA